MGYFLRLPIGYWSCKDLNKVSSSIRKPKHTKQFTASIETNSYAQVLVETNIEKPLIDTTEISNPTSICQQPLEYE